MIWVLTWKGNNVLNWLHDNWRTVSKKVSEICNFLPDKIHANCLSSARMIASSNLTQVPPLLMHMGKWPAVMPATKRSACVAPEVDLGECTLHLPQQKKLIRQNPRCLWNPEETSPEIQNRGTSGPQKGFVPVKNFTKNYMRTEEQSSIFPYSFNLYHIEFNMMCEKPFYAIYTEGLFVIYSKEPFDIGHRQQAITFSWFPYHTALPYWLSLQTAGFGWGFLLKVGMWLQIRCQQYSLTFMRFSQTGSLIGIGMCPRVLYLGFQYSMWYIWPF